MTNIELLAKIKAEIEKTWLEYECYNEDYDKVAEMRWNEFEKVARHLYELGKQSGSSEIPKDLEEAAEISFDEAKSLTEDYIDFIAKGLTENKPRPIGPHWFCEYAKNRFIAGAKWQKEQDDRLVDIIYQQGIEKGKDEMREQMLKEAVDTVVSLDAGGFPFIEFGVGKFGLKVGDKVRVIVLPKED